MGQNLVFSVNFYARFTKIYLCWVVPQILLESHRWFIHKIMVHIKVCII